MHQSSAVLQQAGCIFAVFTALAIDNIKGQKLFDIFQAVLGFIAPSLSVVFLLSVFWKRTTRRAVNVILSWGSAFSLSIGVLYLWVFTRDRYHFWPHYLLLSFYIFAVLFIAGVLISLGDRAPVTSHATTAIELPVTTRRVKIMFGILGVVIAALYIFFNCI